MEFKQILLLMVAATACLTVLILFIGATVINVRKAGIDYAFRKTANILTIGGTRLLELATAALTAFTVPRKGKNNAESDKGVDGAPAEEAKGE